MDRRRHEQGTGARDRHGRRRRTLRDARGIAARVEGTVRDCAEHGHFTVRVPVMPACLWPGTGQ